MHTHQDQQVRKYFRSKFMIDLASQKPAKSIFNGYHQWNMSSTSWENREEKQEEGRSQKEKEKKKNEDQRIKSWQQYQRLFLPQFFPLPWPSHPAWAQMRPSHSVMLQKPCPPHEIPLPMWKEQTVLLSPVLCVQSQRFSLRVTWMDFTLQLPVLKPSVNFTRFHV